MMNVMAVTVPMQTPVIDTINDILAHMSMECRRLSSSAILPSVDVVLDDDVHGGHLMSPELI
jgi:hypothetical protein